MSIRRTALVVLAAAGLAGCVTPVSYPVDKDAAALLPRERAVDFLETLALITGRDVAGVLSTCAFTSTYVMPGIGGGSGTLYPHTQFMAGSQAFPNRYVISIGYRSDDHHAPWCIIEFEKTRADNSRLVERTITALTALGSTYLPNRPGSVDAAASATPRPVLLPVLSGPAPEPTTTSEKKKQ